jgi:hypothetical protein
MKKTFRILRGPPLATFRGVSESFSTQYSTLCTLETSKHRGTGGGELGGGRCTEGVPQRGASHVHGGEGGDATVQQTFIYHILRGPPMATTRGTPIPQLFLELWRDPFTCKR